MQLTQPRFLVGLLVLVLGCTANTESPKGQPGDVKLDAAEKMVRAVIAEQMKVDASAIRMDNSISDPPTKADDLDLVEIVMTLEERVGVEITDAAIERYLGGKMINAPPRITPNQLARIVREAPKLEVKRKK
jgi:acyl carrier protein